MCSNCLKKYEPASKSQLKKIQKIFVRDSYKTEKPSAQGEKNESEILEEAKNIIIEEDKSLPKAELIKIFSSTQKRGSRVKIFGWVHRLRKQGLSFKYVFFLFNLL